MRSFHLIFKFNCTVSSSWPSQEQLCNSPRLSQVWQCPLSKVYYLQGNHLEIVSSYTRTLCFSLLLLPHVTLPSTSCPRQQWLKQMSPWLAAEAYPGSADMYRQDERKSVSSGGLCKYNFFGLSSYGCSLSFLYACHLIHILWLVTFQCFCENLK